jgi:hypothetical protein
VRGAGVPNCDFFGEGLCAWLENCDTSDHLLGGKGASVPRNFKADKAFISINMNRQIETTGSRVKHVRQYRTINMTISYHIRRHGTYAYMRQNFKY